MQNTIAAWCGALGLLMSSPAIGKARQPVRPAAELRSPATEAPDLELASNHRPRLQQQLFAGQLTSPLAPETRLQLNEMIIRSSLSAYGVEPPPDGPEEARKLLSAVPSHVPAVGHLTSEFGTRQSPFNGRLRLHKGIDIAAAHGSPIYAVADGVVVFAGWKGPLGRVVIVNHGFHITTKYAHASALDVERGSIVRRGDILGRVGNSGRSTGTHLHFEVRVGGRAIDPQHFMFELPVGDGLLAMDSQPRLEQGLLDAGEVTEFDEDNDEASLASSIPAVALGAPGAQTRVSLAPSSMSFGYEAIFPASWRQTEITPAGIFGNGIGGESDVDVDEDDAESGVLAPERSDMSFAQDSELSLFPLNFCIVGGFSLIALVLAAGDHLPQLPGRRWRRRRQH